MHKKLNRSSEVYITDVEQVLIFDGTFDFNGPFPSYIFVCNCV